jgi:hypothetical protein
MLSMSRYLHRAALLCVTALSACASSPGQKLAGPTDNKLPGPLFESEAKAFQTKLHQEANAAFRTSPPGEQLVIGVTTNARGKLDLWYVPFALNVRRGDTVTIVSWNGKFNLKLKGHSHARSAKDWPFKEAEPPPPSRVMESSGPAGGLQSLTLTVATDATVGTWYSLNVNLLEKGIEDDICPSIIVE